MKKYFSAILIGLIVSLVAFFNGYRFTAKGAAKVHYFLGKNATLVKEIDTYFGKTFIFNKEDYYMTIRPERKGFLWKASSSYTTKDINDKKDVIRTIAWQNITGKNEKITLMVVEVKDEKVAYIEAGPENDRFKKEVIKGEYVVVYLNNSFFPHQIKPVALSKDGSKLYEYRYPISPNYIDPKELRWYKVE